jgi:hypothetical protein
MLQVMRFDVQAGTPANGPFNAAKRAALNAALKADYNKSPISLPAATVKRQVRCCKACTCSFCCGVLLSKVLALTSWLYLCCVRHALNALVFDEILALAVARFCESCCFHHLAPVSIIASLLMINAMYACSLPCWRSLKATTLWLSTLARLTTATLMHRRGWSSTGARK